MQCPIRDDGLQGQLDLHSIGPEPEAISCKAHRFPVPCQFG